jgi:hypothetical protein
MVWSTTLWVYTRLVPGRFHNLPRTSFYLQR